MRSRFFTEQLHSDLEQKVVAFINSNRDIMSSRTLNSPRAVGDAIQELLQGEFPNLLPQGMIKEYNPSFARRSMADFAFLDMDGFYYVVDNKTHNLSTVFNMPNLTSVERLARFYEDDNNYFTLLMVAYEVAEGQLKAAHCHFLPIEHLSWSCLTLGALGWGQIQIANSNRIDINREQLRRTWMLEMCDRLAEFYPKEIEKITRRIAHFEKVKEYWERHEAI